MSERNCKTCGRETRSECGKIICNQGFTAWIPKPKTISFPILNGLAPTLESCTKKVFEEIGELMQLLGKGQRQSGELIEQLNNRNEWVIRTVEEALDGAQALVTLVCTLLDEHGDIEIAMERHTAKLRQKGYLK